MKPAKRAVPVEAVTDILDLDHDGRGLARVAGKVTFIAGALPGERVRYRLSRTGRQVDEGELLAIEQASPDRITPRCPHFGVCGGCSLQHLSALAQIKFKQKQMLDALERIGKVSPEQIAPPITGPAWSYRRRSRLSVYRSQDSGIRIGYKEKESPFTAQLESCDVLDERVGHKLKELAQCLERLDVRTVVPQVEVSAAEQVVLVFRVLHTPTTKDLDVLREFGAQQKYTIYLQSDGPDSVRPLDQPAELSYSPDGSGLTLVFQPGDFIQVNDTVNQSMVRQALDWLAPQPGERVLELFSGLGNFTLLLAKTGARVTAVEGEADLVARARANAQRNGLEIRFEQADLFKPNPAASWLKQKYEAVLLDPPRAGAREILPHLALLKAERILYISCHTGTLARDAAFLTQITGYRLTRAGILDMFPHTAHVESMALFVKGEAGREHR